MLSIRICCNAALKRSLHKIPILLALINQLIPVLLFPFPHFTPFMTFTLPFGQWTASTAR